MHEYQSTPLIPIRDFFRNPEITGYQISPDGTRLSFLKPWEHRLNIYIQNLDGTGETRITASTERDIRAYFWKGNDHIIFLQDIGGDENWHLFSVDIQEGTERELTPFPGVLAEIVDELDDHPTDMLIAMNNRNPELLDVFRVNVMTGEMHLVAENPGGVMGWVADNAGTLRIATVTDSVNSEILYRESDDAPFVSVLRTSFKETISPLFFDFEDKYCYVASNIGRDKSEIIKYDFANNTELELIYRHDEVDVSNLLRSKKRKAITGALYTDWKIQYAFFDETRKSWHDHLEQALPGYEVHIISQTREEDAAIVLATGDRSAGKYYYYNTVTGEIRELAIARPWLNEEHLSQMQPITYTSRDGLTIHGYLALPHGAEPTNLPVVINPHGGPWHRDIWGYNPEIQFLANRGYAVLQMNFRGSTGYGRKFWEASFRQWGKTMQDDITDGVQWLIDQGIADPKRIGIYGGSYGGYATLAGLTFTPDVYACGVDFVGVSNLFTFMNTIPPYWKPILDMLHEMVGHPEHDAELLRSASPVFHADNIRVPLLIAQGANDPRVNKDESDQMVAALKTRGIDVPYIVKDNEGHGFYNEENKFEFYRAMEVFLGKYLGGRIEEESEATLESEAM